jgi:hypothetical protein
MSAELLDEIEMDEPETRDFREIQREVLAWRRERGDLQGGAQLAKETADRIDMHEELSDVQQGILEWRITEEMLWWIGAHSEELGLCRAACHSGTLNECWVVCDACAKRFLSSN